MNQFMRKEVTHLTGADHQTRMACAIGGAIASLDGAFDMVTDSRTAEHFIRQAQMFLLAVHQPARALEVVCDCPACVREAVTA
jgi:hypothetical protein